MQKRSFAALALPLLILCAPTPSGAESQILTHFDVGYARSVEPNAPGGSVGLAFGLIFRKDKSPFGIGTEIGYANLGSLEHTTSVSYSGRSTEKKRWFCSHITVQGYGFLSGRDQATFYPTIGLGYYDFHGADHDAMKLYPRIPPAIQSEGAFGGNVGVGWLSSRLNRSPVFGFDLRLHSLRTKGKSTELITAQLRLCFH